MSRYLELLKLIDQYKPRTIVEIGVWNGANAIRMIQQAQKYHQDIVYTGYDLFEGATSQTDATEFNVKGHNSMWAVAAYIKAETGVTPTLIKGDTNQTLLPITADFVFLDGGHSIGTIEHDYSCVRDSKIIVLDDYYTSDGGACPDVSKFGCNRLLESAYLTMKPKFLPVKDPVKGGGYTQLVVVCQ